MHNFQAASSQQKIQSSSQEHLAEEDEAIHPPTQQVEQNFPFAFFLEFWSREKGSIFLKSIRRIARIISISSPINWGLIRTGMPKTGFHHQSPLLGTSFPKYSPRLSPLDKRSYRFIFVRGLMLIAHLVLAECCLMSRDGNVKASLHWNFTPDEYSRKDTELIAATSLTVFFVISELVTFGSGLTMYNKLSGSYSLMAHASGAMLHSYFLFDSWDIEMYWWIFSLTACMPLTFDIGSIFVMFCTHRGRHWAE